MHIKLIESDSKDIYKGTTFLLQIKAILLNFVHRRILKKILPQFQQKCFDNNNW